MNILSLVHLTAFVGDVALIIVVISRNYKARLNRLCSLVAAAFAFWSFGYCVTHVVTNPQLALFWISISSIGWITFPMAALYFYLALAGKEKISRNKWLFSALVLITAFFFYGQWSGNIVGKVIQKSYGWSGVWSNSLYSYLLFFYFICAMGTILYLIYDYRRQVTAPSEKIQARLLQITASVSATLAVTSDILLPNLHITAVPQLADICMFVWALGIVICVTRYGLMSVTPATAAEQILDTTTDMLFLLETGGKIRQCNPAALEALEFNQRELYGDYFSGIAADNNTVDDLLEKTRQKGKSVSREMVFKTKNNGNINVLVSASVIRDRTEAVIGFVISAKDITELNQTQNALKRQKELTDRCSIILLTPCW